MLRLSPFHAGDEFFHVVLRVDRREALADSARDRRVLNEIAIDAMRRFDIKLHAYCLMDNHLRALIQVDIRLLAKGMLQVATRYSRWRRRSLKTSEHLFERPYKAQRVESEARFLEQLRFIHLNPVIANKAIVPGDYPWSSHRAYVGYKSNALITTDLGLSLLAPDPAKARAAYQRFIADGLTDDIRGLEVPDGISSTGETSIPALNCGSHSDDVPRIPQVMSQLDLAHISSFSRVELRRKRAKRFSRQYLSIY